MKIATPNIKFLIPFDAKYFLLGVNLIQNFIDCQVEAGKIIVVDYGLNQNQISFLNDAGVQILKTPQNLIGSHPYLLKSHLSDYLSENPFERDYLVQLDADMLLLRNPESELMPIINEMERLNAHIALCPDMGPKNRGQAEIGPSLENFLSLYECPKFRKLLTPKNLNTSYFNTGFTIYSPKFNLVDFQKIADQMIGEVVWEQNAMNCVIANNPQIVYPLDPKLWNLHGILMDQFSKNDNPVIIHITSPTPNAINVGPLELNIGEYKLETFYFRQSNNQSIKAIQDSMLQSLLERNQALFIKYLTVN